jgi:hypothetical protein
MTDTDNARKLIAEAREVMDGVTPGEWRVKKCQCGHPSCRYFGTDNGSFMQGSGYSEADARFIASSSRLVPALADALGAALEREERLREALRSHHDWHLTQDRDGGAWGIDPVDAYSESGLCEMTCAALQEKPHD